MEKSEESRKYVTGVHRNIAEEDNVQIKANKDELMNRITVFMQLKKKQVDFSNEQEFISKHNKQSDYSEMSTCARVDCNRVTRGHITVRKVVNVEGPNGNLPKPEEELWAQLVLTGNNKEQDKNQL